MTIGTRLTDLATARLVAASTQPSPMVTPPSTSTPACGCTGANGGQQILPGHGCPSGEDASSGLGDLTWDNIVSLGAALLVVSGVILTLLVNAARSRRENLATLYADALGAVAEYLEGPYRVLRKDGEKSTRFALTSKLSDVKASVDHSQALLRLHARQGVADAYDAYVHTVRAEVGQQIHEAWKAPPVTTDEGVSIGAALPRTNSHAARDRLVKVMQADLARRWYLPRTRRRYDTAVSAACT